MSKTTAINSAVIASIAEQSRSIEVENRDRRVASAPRDDKTQPKVDVQALQKELQTKRKLLNLLEEKGVAHKIDIKAIDKALADLNAIIGSKGNV